MKRVLITMLIGFIFLGIIFAGEGGATELKYDRTAAKDYAARYCKEINKDKYDFYTGVDCANFVSQALINGGLDFGCVGKANIIGKDGNTKGIAGAKHLISVLQENFCFIRSLSCKEGDVVAYKNKYGNIKHVAIVDENCNVAAHTSPYCFDEKKGPGSLLGDELKSYEIYTFQDYDKCKKCELEWSDVAFNVCKAKMTDKATPCETCTPSTGVVKSG